MKVVLTLNNEQKELLKSFTTSKLELTLDKCHNFTQYYKLFNDKTKKHINDIENIIHAHEYDRDDQNVYYFVLSTNFDLVDLSVPLNLDLSKTEFFSELSEDEIKIVKLLKTKML